MNDRINLFLERVADFIAERPGLLPLLGVGLILLNFLLQLYPGAGNWVVDTDLLLHVGLVVSIIGLLLVRPLS